jgi:hypothetical protein
MPCNQSGSEVEGSTPKGAGPLFCLDHAEAHAARTHDPAAATDDGAGALTRGGTGGVAGMSEGRKVLWADPQPVPPWEWAKQRK